MAETLSSSPGSASIFDALLDAYICLDREFRYTFVNRASEQLLGTSRTDLLGKVLWEVYPELGGTNFESCYRRAMGERISVAFEEYYAPWQRWHSITAIPLPDSNDGIMVRTLDITGRKQAEMESVLSRQRMALHVERTPLAVMEFDIFGRVSSWNPGAVRTFGFSSKEAIGQPWTFLVPKSFWAALDGVWESLVTQHGGSRSTNRNITKDGRAIICEWFNTPLIDTNGTVMGVASLVLDITEGQRAEEALKENEQLLSESQRAAHVGSWSWDLATDAMAWTPELYRVFGVSPDTFVPSGEALLSVIHPDDRTAVQSWIVACMAGEEPPALEFRVNLAGGGVRYIYGRGSLVRDAENQPVRMTGIGQDITDRKQAEEDLRHLAAIVEFSDDAIIGKTPDGIITSWNWGAECVYGYTKDEVLGRSIAMLIPPEHLEELTDILDHVKRGERVRHFEAERVRKDGGRVFLSLTVSPIRDVSGRIVGASTIGRDITERKRGEAALRESEGRFAAFMTHLPAAAFVKDEAGRTLFANQYLQDLLSFRGWEGKATRSLIAGEVGQQMEEDDREALAHGPLKFHETLVDSHGASRTFETIKFPIPLGKTALLGGIATDITERQGMETALREAEAKFRAMFLNGPDALYLATLEEGKLINVSDINSPFEALFGYSRDEAVGKTSLELGLYANPADRARMVAKLKANGKVTEFETEGRRKSGELFPCSLSVVTMMLGGEPRILGAIRDITERKRAEQEKTKLQLQLAQAQKMESVGRLAGGVAHDFNNLLTVINGYSKLLLRDLKKGDPLRDSLEEIHKAGERAKGLTRQLLAFSRKQILEPRRLDVNRVVAEMRPMLERLVGEDIEVRFALHAEGGTIHADPHQLEQVVMNLVVNARDAMPGAGKLLVETANAERDESYVRSHPEARAGRYVMLAVSDTGAGIDEETKHRIFEPFFTTKEVGKGTGLGLAMVQGIVAQSGGYVEVDSETGKGTTFKIYLPALTEAAADDSSPEVFPALGGKETVLVVEDQEEVRKYAAMVLKEYGYRVIPAENAGKALLLCQRERFDLLLTDVVMPHVSGRELADRVEKIQPGIKALFMSGYSDNVIAPHGVLEEGANFIQKPFSPEELAGKVRSVLGLPAPAPRILVADDEAGVRAFLRKVLEDGGYEVIEAADGKQALRQASAGRADLVITDLVMPEVEGIEAIQALRRDVPGVRIIAISGAFGGQFLETARMLGADAVLIKPVNGDLLLAKVAEVLKVRR